MISGSQVSTPAGLAYTGQVRPTRMLGWVNAGVDSLNGAAAGNQKRPGSRLHNGTAIALRATRTVTPCDMVILKMGVLKWRAMGFLEHTPH